MRSEVFIPFINNTKMNIIDFGDIIFFIVFLFIIISNIMKAMKKSGKQTPENKEAGAQPGKKSGWKNVLEQMLEEARKQMENQAEPESAGSPPKHPAGWEDIITGKSPVKRESKIRPERAKTVRSPKQPIILDDLFPEKAKFRPECMRCDKSMKELADLGTGKQSGLIYCDSCGEKHKYQILNGELKLKQADAIRKKSVRAPERIYQEVEEKSRTYRKMHVTKPTSDALPAGKIKIPRQMSQADLRTAVVWSEILGKPLGLRDMEI
jgi:transcription elongation factor Elf1